MGKEKIVDRQGRSPRLWVREVLAKGSHFLGGDVTAFDAIFYSIYKRETLTLIIPLK